MGEERGKVQGGRNEGREKGRARQRQSETHAEKTISPRKYCPVWRFLDDSLRWLITGINWQAATMRT